MSGLAEFRLFPLLPAELRIRIWALALPGPRIVEVRCGSDSIPDHNYYYPYAGASLLPPCFHLAGRQGKTRTVSATAGCLSAASLPVTLAVSREARAETLRRYEPMFGFAGRPGRVYFDPSRDVLYFGAGNGGSAARRAADGGGLGLMRAPAQFMTVAALCEADLARVTRLAIDEAVLGPVPVLPLRQHWGAGLYAPEAATHHHVPDDGWGETDAFQHHPRRIAGWQEDDDENEEAEEEASLVAQARAVYQLLSQHVASRLPALEELIFVSDSATQQRFDLVAADAVVGGPPTERAVLESKGVLEGAIGLAIRKMARTVPGWRTPAWSVCSRKAVCVEDDSPG